MLRRSERLMKKTSSTVKPEEQPISPPPPISSPSPKVQPSNSVTQENQIKTRNPPEWLNNYIQFTDQATGPERQFRLFQLFQIILMEYPELISESEIFYNAFVQKLRDFRSASPALFAQLSSILPSIVLLDM